MAKVQGKKTAVAKRAASRPAARPKAASAGKKAAKKPVAPKARAAKTKPAPKPAPKPVAKAKAVAKTALKAVKSIATKAAKPAPKAAAPAAKPAPKPTPAPKLAPKPAPKAVEKPQPPKAAPKPITISAPRPAPAPAVEKRARRARPRVTSSGGPVANWLQSGAEKPRPSSFMPAPPRAEAPSLVAAPPASSDRLIRNEDLIAPAVRTVPVRIDVEAAGGRVFIYPNPAEVALKPGEGIEWDFRYLGGADVTVDEIVIEFDKPSPFPQQVFRCKKPGIGRPQRQLSGGAAQASSGRRVQYTIRAMTAFKTELGAAKTFVTIV